MTSGNGSGGRSVMAMPIAAAVALVAAGALVLSGCGGNNSTAVAPSCTVTASSNVVTSSTAAPSGSNVMSVTVNGSQCAASITEQYPNEPCVSIQVCTPGGSCATIPNLLLDTGSFGIRIYSSVLSGAGVSPAGISLGGGRYLTECVGFGDGSSEWGEVGTADVVMAGESKISSMPIMVINSTFATPPSDSTCNSANSTPDTGPSETGFNGIVGVGLLDQDCGTDCVGASDNGQYYSCTPGGNCVGSTATLAQQVRNPVAALGSDNNGVILQLPSIGDGGASSVSGYLVLGIGTQSNNQVANVQMYPADANLTMTSVFNPFSSESLVSFIDSGSSLLFFPWPPTSNPSASTLLPDCGGNLSGFYCPQSEQSFATANTGNGGSPTSCVGFNVANANSQLSGNNMVFANLAGASGSDISSDFDWGLPFFLGRKVYVGISGKSATGLGTGPYWAY